MFVLLWSLTQIDLNIGIPFPIGLIAVRDKKGTTEEDESYYDPHRRDTYKRGLSPISGESEERRLPAVKK